MRQIVSALAIIGALLIVVFSFHVLLVGFAGLLLAILLSSVAEWVQSYTRIPRGWSMVLVVFLLVVVLAGNIWLFGRSFAGQIDEMREGMVRARDQLFAFSQKYEWSQRIWPRAMQQSEGAMLSGTRSAVTGSISMIAGFILMLFIGLYVASNPGMYRRGVIRMFPQNSRHKAQQSIDAIGNSLKWWILGQMISMAVVGVATTIGLLALGCPLPFTLGFITAVLNFIPNIGAIVSALLAMMLALTNGVESMLSVLALFLVIQACEAYILTPMIQHRAVSLPPALTIIVQAIMGVLVGGIGLALAAPLTVVGLVLTRQLYLKEGRSGGPRSARRAAEVHLPKASNE
jgi:predicted PurR-regulated permease PerM